MYMGLYVFVWVTSGWVDQGLAGPWPQWDMVTSPLWTLQPLPGMRGLDCPRGLPPSPAGCPSQVSYLCFGFRSLTGAAAGDTFYLFLSESPETGFLFVFALQCLRSLFILNHLKNILTSHSTTNKKSLQRLNCFIFLHANIRATSGVTGAASLRPLL